MSFNYLLIANRLLPAHTYDPADAVCCNDLHLGTSAVTNWEVYLQQRSFLLNANSLRRSTCSWSQDFVSVVCVSRGIEKARKSTHRNRPPPS